MLSWNLQNYWDCRIKMAFWDLSRMDKKWVELEKNFIQWEKFANGDRNWEYSEKGFLL